MEIDLREYLSDTDIKEICEDEVRKLARDMFASESTVLRILSNTSYEVVKNTIDAQFDIGMEKAIYDKVPEIINNLASYNVFSPPNAWDRKASKGWEVLQDAINDNKKLIEQKVIESINKIDLEDVTYRFKELIDEAVENVLRGNK